MSGLYFEELTLNKIFKHSVRRTVTEMDNVLFSSLTMNPAALHLDEDYCLNHTEFKARIVNSSFALGLIIGLSVADTTMGTTIANLGFDEVRFPHPIFHGDTIRAETEVIERRESKSRPNAGIIVFEHRGFNQKNVLIANLKRSALMLKKPTCN